MSKLPVQFRQQKDSDRGYLRSTWVDCLREHAVDTALRSIPAREYRARWSRIVERLLDSVQVTVACDPQDQDTILGFVVWEPETPDHPVRLHWIHVRRELQGFGLGRSLLAEAGLSLRDEATAVQYSARTVRWDRVRKPECWKYLPWLTLGV